MKLIIFGYWEKNLGDDLFLLLLRERVLSKIDGVEAYILTRKCHKKYYQEMGYHPICKDSIVNRALDKMASLLSTPEIYYYRYTQNNIFLMLGGSLFEESENKEINKRQFRNLSCAVRKAAYSFCIGSNFGPYKDEGFVDGYRELFSKMKDVCFRDKASADLFKNTHWAPDIVLGGKDYLKSIVFNENELMNSTTIADYDIVVPINLRNRKNLKKFTKQYEEALHNLIYKTTGLGRNIVILNFCEFEGDGVAIESIIEQCKLDCDMNLIHIITYEKIDTMLSYFKGASTVYATRFHATILALLFNKNFVPIIYSSKTKNALDSYCRNVKFITVENFTVEKIEEIMSWNNVKVDREWIYDEAKKQFDAIENWI